MNNNNLELETRIMVIVNQRNRAMDEIAILSGLIALRDARIKELEQTDGKIEVNG